jgi:hypothetical protein
VIEADMDEMHREGIVGEKIQPLRHDPDGLVDAVERKTGEGQCQANTRHRPQSGTPGGPNSTSPICSSSQESCK